MGISLVPQKNLTSSSLLPSLLPLPPTRIIGTSHPECMWNLGSRLHCTKLGYPAWSPTVSLINNLIQTPLKITFVLPKKGGTCTVGIHFVVQCFRCRRGSLTRVVIFSIQIQVIGKIGGVKSTYKLANIKFSERVDSILGPPPNLKGKLPTPRLWRNPNVWKIWHLKQIQDGSLLNDV